MFTNSFKQTLFAALAIGCAFTAVSCSKDNHDEIDDGVKINTGGIQFSLREEPFQKDIHFTRGVDMKPLSVDLDSMEAEVTLEPDTAQTKVQTRATISDGNYTIIAFRKSDGKRLDQKLTGTMSYGRFTPTGSSRNMFKWLPQDTYIFVCFNDKVTDNGNHVLTASGDGCIGRTEQTLTKRDETVKFEMKHVGARVKIQIMAYMPTPAGMKAKITLRLPVQCSMHFPVHILTPMAAIPPMR